MRVHWKLTLTIALILFATLYTNRWPRWEGGIRLLSASDVVDGYLPVAKAAPSLPLEAVPFHKAQRFFFPYLIGMASAASGASIPASFDVCLALVNIATLGLLLNLMGEVSPRRKALAVGLFAFQPYTLRYYWIVPGMLSDCAFEFGLLIWIAGLYKRRVTVVLAGVVIATLARQTGILVLPATFFWMELGTGWRELPARHRRLCAVVTGISGLILYWGTARIAMSFGSPNVNAEHLTGIFAWLCSPEFSAFVLAEHVLRCTLPLIPSCVLLGLERRRTQEASWLVLMAATIAAQPLLAGPVTTGQNAARLVTLGIPALVIAWARSGRAWSLPLCAALLALLFLGSFHHLYTVIGPSSASGSAGLQIVVVAGAVALAWRARRVTA